MDAKKLASLFDNPNFAKWFGNSAVVDESGAPRVMYHGTKKAFDSFDAKKSSKTDRAMTRFLGHFFTDDLQDATRYANWNGQNGDVMETLLAINKPYRMPYSEADSMNMHTLGKMKESGYRFSDADVKKWDTEAKKAVLARRKELQGQGYDGIFLESPSGDIGEYIAFSPTQIKSTSNRGTFDPNDPNIYRAALPVAATGGLMAAMSPSESQAAQRIRAMDGPIEDAWNPLEAFAGGIPGGLKAAAMGVLPDGAMDWAINRIGGLMSGGK